MESFDPTFSVIVSDSFTSVVEAGTVVAGDARVATETPEDEVAEIVDVFFVDKLSKNSSAEVL